MNSTMDPVLMKVLLKKKKFMGLINSAWDPLDTAFTTEIPFSKKGKKKG